MSLRFYGFAPELDGSDNGKLKAGRFQGIMGVLDSLCGKVRFRKFWFDVVGTTAAAVLDHAVYLYEQVANMSLGVIFSASQKLGHYRNDELPSVLAANKRANGYVIVSTGCNDGVPKTMSQKVKIPYVLDTVSPADIKAVFAGKKTYTSGTAGLGRVGWENADKTVLGAYYTDEAVGAGVSDYEKLNSFDLVSIDDGAGVDASDPVLGEAA